MALTKFEAKLISKGWTETFRSIKFQIKIKKKKTNGERVRGARTEACSRGQNAVKIETKTQQHGSKTLWLRHTRTRSASERDTNNNTTDYSSNTIFLCLSLSNSFLLFRFVSLTPCWSSCDVIGQTHRFAYAFFFFPLHSTPSFGFVCAFLFFILNIYAY